jgi:ABC-type nitrate/sulfonate/bicarbonate transport system permease component
MTEQVQPTIGRILVTILFGIAMGVIIGIGVGETLGRRSLLEQLCEDGFVCLEYVEPVGGEGYWRLVEEGR